MRWAVVEDGVVVQVIAWDGVATYDPGPGRTLIQHDRVNAGWTVVDGVLVAPEPQVEPDPWAEPSPA